MALITTISRATGTYAVIEDSNYIYIHGQAYTKNTLTPVFGISRQYYTGWASSSIARLARGCTIPDFSTSGFCHLDSTAGDPAGLISNHGVYEYGSEVFTFPGLPDSSTWNTSNTAVYNKFDGAGVYHSHYGIAAAYRNIMPVGFVTGLSQILTVMADGCYEAPANGPFVQRWALTPAAGASVTTGNAAGLYAFTTSLLSENATYWFIASIHGNGVSTNACTLKLDAVAKSNAAVTNIINNVVQSTTFPRLMPSNPYSQSTDSKWSYIAGANAADPYFTVRYNNYNHNTLGNTGGDCTIDWNGSSATVEFSSIVKTSRDTCLRTWVVTGTADSFVYFAVCDDGSTTAQTVSNMKMYGFKINSGTPSSIQFKETIAIGTIHGRIRNIFPITNDWRTIAVMTDSAATLYTWDDTNGYTAGTTIPYSIKNSNPGLMGTFGVDTLGRIWVVSSGGGGSTVSVYSTTTATTITLNFASSSYNYTGTTINSSFNLSAYNASGSRIATDIQVVLDSSNITFSDDTTPKTITTSAGGEVSTNVKITGPGQIRAVANVAV